MKENDVNPQVVTLVKKHLESLKESFARYYPKNEDPRHVTDKSRKKLPGSAFDSAFRSCGTERRSFSVPRMDVWEQILQKISSLSYKLHIDNLY
ncbi:hypothetical protein TNCV_1191471 [Trichonephila clavipes]|nr:hypothetical protein TNCV_1191471 [Trichonephila clavipes]